jgi:hypothetical protein
MCLRAIDFSQLPKGKSGSAKKLKQFSVILTKPILIILFQIVKNNISLIIRKVKKFIDLRSYQNE